MEQQDIIDRLIVVTQHFRLTNNGFANKCGLGSSNYRRMLKGEIKITDKTLHKIANATGVRFEWLLYGEGQMFGNNGGNLQTAECDVTQTGNNSNNITNSTELFTKALDEIAAQRKLTEQTQTILQDAQATIAKLSEQLINIIQKDK